MKKLEGTEKENPVPALNKLGDLIWFEGPVLSHFADRGHRDYLMLWVDSSKTLNRWLCFETDELDIYRYLNGRESLHELICNNDQGVVRYYDIDKNANYKKETITYTDKIPKSYLPEKDEKFNIDFATQYAKDLKERLRFDNEPDERLKPLYNFYKDTFGAEAVSVRVRYGKNPMLGFVNTDEHYLMGKLLFSAAVYYRSTNDERYRNYAAQVIKHADSLNVRKGIQDFVVMTGLNAPRSFRKAYMGMTKAVRIIVDQNPKLYSKPYNVFEKEYRKEARELREILAQE
jgi:hypothetical protein